MQNEDITLPLVIDIGFKLGEMMQKIQTTPYFLKENTYLHKSTQGSQQCILTGLCSRSDPAHKDHWSLSDFQRADVNLINSYVFN